MNDQNQSHPLYLYVVSTVAALGGLLFGFDIGVIAGAIPFITEQLHLDAHQEGFAVGNILIGALIGSLAGALSDRFGRRRILIFAAVLLTVSAISSALSRSYWELVAARFVGGLGVGASMVSALYISEIAPAAKRGFLVSLNQFAIVTGILLTYYTNWLLVDAGPNNWRWMFGLEALPAVVFFVALFFVPESPRWLVKQNRTVEAGQILAKVAGTENAQSELADIQATIEEETGSIFELFKPGLRKALLIGVLISVFAQVTGIGAIVYYAPTIFMASGDESSAALFASVLIGLTNFLGTIVSFFIIDRFGRKPLLYVGLVGMGLSLLGAGSSADTEVFGVSLMLVSIISYIWFYAISLGPVGWVLVAEIYPTKIRGFAMAICLMVLWLSDFIVAYTFPWLNESLGQGVFNVYAGICVLAFLFAWFIVVETKGKTLEEIEGWWS